MSWPEGKRYLFPQQSLVVSLLLSLVSTLVFSRTRGILSHLNSSTHRFPRFPPRNLCFYVMLAVFSLSSSVQRTQYSVKLLSFQNWKNRKSFLQRLWTLVPGHLSSHSALSSYELFASLTLWQFSVSLRPLVQALGSCQASGSLWSSAMNPSLGRGRVATRTTAKLKLQMYYYVTKGVSKFRRSKSCKKNYVTICNLLSQDSIINYLYTRNTTTYKKSIH